MRWLRCIFFALVVSQSTAQQSSAYELNSSKGIERVSPHFLFYEDLNNEEDISKVLNSGKFVKPQLEVPNFNVTRSTIWAKIRLITREAADWYISVDPSSFSQLTLYQKKNSNGWKERTIGNSIPDGSRQVHFSHFVFKLDIHPGDTALLLVKLKDFFPISLDIKAAPLEEFIGMYSKTDMYNGLCFGVMLMMLIYNLYLFVTSRALVYLYYVLYVFFSMVFTGILAGYAYYLPMPFQKLCYEIPIIPPASFGIFGLLFTLGFFREVFSSRFRKLIYCFIGIALADILLSATPFKHLAFMIIQPLGVFLGILSISAGIIAFRKKHSGAKYYLIGFGAYMLSLFYIILAAAGIVPIYTFTWCALITGSVVECIFLSFALGDKFRLAQAEKEKAQLETLVQAMENERLVKEQNTLLEKKVKERTIELQQQKEEIENQKELLEEKQKEILDSIHYAQRIQNSILPNEKQIDKVLRRINRN
jgi:hypothetical protein